MNPTTARGMLPYARGMQGMEVMSKAAFVTIGQTPRADLVPEIREWLGAGVDIEEFGALDGLDRQAISRLAPQVGDHRLVTRLADGSEAVVAKGPIHERLQTIFDDLTGREFCCTVLLCTGHFKPFRTHGLFLEAQSIVDQSATAIAAHARRIGLMLPLGEQIEEFHFHPIGGQTVKASYASPYTPGRLECAAHELADTDLILMHCIGYTESMRRTVRAASGRPVLLARRLVAAAVAQLV